ncbi:hypothetical protein [Actinoplanes aureus]|uniref:Uncharacterized protein n=1 Tax=Actinoplanes aureus TaxID=2792083 RepID=A0A931CFJ0_9ACTN|nr:hypothetical protein [Actinoplanes aureus]MBG0569199.1 hypothetical protein [Actinoplanes aureus]
MLNDETRPTCERCQFRLHDERDYLARITPDDVPAAVAERVVGALNGMADAERFRQAAPLVDRAVPGQPSLIDNLLDRRPAGGFTDLAAVAGTPELSSGRFSELVAALGVDRQPYEPEFARGSTQPSHGTFSASRTELDFSYQMLTPGAGEVKVLQGARCSACRTNVPSFNDETNSWEARLQITRLIIDGGNADATVNVTMDHSLNPFDFMKPVDRDAPTFQFPALMQLNNNMILKVRPAGGETLTLVSRDAPVQVGIIHHWPPYGMRLHSVGTTDYHVLGDPEATPVLRVLDGTTFLTGPSNFLNHRADIVRHRYTPPEAPGRLPSVALSWKPVPPGDEYEREADYYHVYRGISEDSWSNVSGPVSRTEWVDLTAPPVAGALSYRVVPVWVTSMGEIFEGFPGQPLRVEPAGSSARQ